MEVTRCIRVWRDELEANCVVNCLVVGVGGWIHTVCSVIDSVASVGGMVVVLLTLERWERTSRLFRGSLDGGVCCVYDGSP